MSRVTAIDAFQLPRPGTSVLKTSQRAARLVKKPYCSSPNATPIATRRRCKEGALRLVRSSDDERKSTDSYRTSVSNISAVKPSDKRSRASPPASILTRKKLGPREGQSMAISSDDEFVKLGPKNIEAHNAFSKTESLLDSKKRDRGRPPTTGKAVLKRAIAEREQKLRKFDKEIADMEEITAVQYDPKQRWKSTDYKAMAELEEDYKILPSQDIVAWFLESANTINGVVTKSGNLKGMFVRALKGASMVVKVGSDVLSARSCESTGLYEVE